MGWAAIAGMAVSAAGSIMKGNADKSAANSQADAELAQAKVQASRIRRAASDTRSEATAAYAASGVDVTAGTPLVVEGEITRRSEQDALSLLNAGEQRAAALRKSGKAAQTGGYLSAAGSVLGGAGKFGGGGWKTAAGGTGGSGSTGAVWP